MGRKKHWRLSLVDTDPLGDSKTQVHNYIGIDDQSKYLQRLYEATTTAVLDGVKFPEIRGTDAEVLLNLKTQVHNYIGTGNLVFGSAYLQPMGWYNPFDEPDPPWAADMPGNDALPF